MIVFDSFFRIRFRIFATEKKTGPIGPAEIDRCLLSSFADDFDRLARRRFNKAKRASQTHLDHAEDHLEVDVLQKLRGGDGGVGFCLGEIDDRGDWEADGDGLAALLMGDDADRGVFQFFLSGFLAAIFRNREKVFDGLLFLRDLFLDGIDDFFVCHIRFLYRYLLSVSVIIQNHALRVIEK